MDTHLNSLKALLLKEKKSQDLLFSCIQDLVAHGLTVARFSGFGTFPQRQDITQYLAAWFKLVDIPRGKCLEWLIVYCVDVLASISSSSISQIKHSTKSNVKYIYDSPVYFTCQQENNPFKAPCQKNCTFDFQKQKEYLQHIKQEQEIKRQEEISKRKAEIAAKSAPKPIKIKVLKKEEYKDQLEKALQFAENLLNQGSPKKEIVLRLNKKGFKTRTGAQWTYELLS